MTDLASFGGWWFDFGERASLNVESDALVLSLSPAAIEVASDLGDMVAAGWARVAARTFKHRSPAADFDRFDVEDALRPFFDPGALSAAWQPARRAEQGKPALGDRGEDTGVTIGEFLVSIGLDRITGGHYALWYDPTTRHIYHYTAPRPIKIEGSGCWLMVEATNEPTRDRVGLDYGLILGSGVEVEGKRIQIERCALGCAGGDLRDIRNLRLTKAALVEKRDDGVVAKARLTEGQLVAHLRNVAWPTPPFRGEIPKQSPASTHG